MIQQLVIQLWESLKSRDKKSFSELVEKDAVIVCGGRQCSGQEYSQMMENFGCQSYDISQFEIIAETVDLIQVHYTIKILAATEENRNVSGTFHITSTWRREKENWKLIFNMDSRIPESPIKKWEASKEIQVSSFDEKNTLLANLSQLHTTSLGTMRIKRNLSLDTDHVVDWCRNKILSPDAVIERCGKNWYISAGSCILTVNAHSYTLITAHKKH